MKSIEQAVNGRFDALRQSCQRAWHRLILKVFSQHFQDEWAEAIHPESGWFWRENEGGGKALKAAEQAGWQSALRAITASLEMYPYGGGDKTIMVHVERIAEEHANKCLSERSGL